VCAKPKKCRLPDGTIFHCLGRQEALYIYAEIFDSGCYRNDLIDYADGGVVVDVGANIGLFVHFVASKCSNSTVYALEPIPEIFEVLRLNAGHIQGQEVHLLNLGVSRQGGTERFHYLPNCPSRSSRCVEGSPLDTSPGAREDENEFAHHVLEQQPNRAMARAFSLLPRFVRSCLASGLARHMAKTKPVSCRVESLSRIMQEHNIGKIDLLKIDAECSEVDILCGIAEEDWPRIRQLVIEVHSRPREGLERVLGILDEHDYEVVVDPRTHCPDCPVVFAARRR
jgi:FkbM family methyltransferase